jgi:hypothetical protein
MDTVVITECQQTGCAYNHDNKCRALGITVGDEQGPACDTFCSSETEGGDPDRGGRVGACKLEQCKYNDRLECGAPSVRVNSEDGGPACGTFETGDSPLA